MAENTNEVIRRYLQDAIAAESSFESQLRSFSGDGDDEEVQSLFASHADQTHQQLARLSARLEQLGGRASVVKGAVAELFGFLPKPAQTAQTEEERIAQNLMAAFSVETGECAIYEALANAAQAAGDTSTEGLAREIQNEERQTAEKIWAFIPSRAKIAYNLLTAGEVDPAIETRATENRLVS